MDEPGPLPPRGPGQSDCTTEAAAEGSARGRLAEGNGGVPSFSFSSSSSLEGGSVNGDGDRGGRRPRRRKRALRSDGQRGGAWTGMSEDSVWFERSVYERAESAYQAWLAGGGGGVGGAPEESHAPALRSPPSQPSDCRHGDQVACHHLVQAVWVNKSAFESAERHFMERAPPSLAPLAPPSLPPPSLAPLALPSLAPAPLAAPSLAPPSLAPLAPPSLAPLALPSLAPLATPTSLTIAPHRGAPAGTRRTPDEGYLSLTPTPATPLPLTPQRQSINGLPGLPTELLTAVWVEKPRYDRAEAAYYQSLCRQLATPSAAPADTPTCSGAEPASGLGVQWGDPEDQQGAAIPAGGAGQDVRLCFLHPDSEGAWLEAPRFHAAEKLFREREALPTATVAVSNAVNRLPPTGPSESDPPAPSMHCPEVSSCDRPSVAAVSSESAELRPAAPLSVVSHGLCTDSSTMTGMEFLAQEKIWFDKFRYDEAERRFYERMNGPTHPSQETGANTILQDIARARENIQKSLSGGVPCGAGDQGELITRMKSLELENQNLHRVVEDLRSALCKLESRVALLEKRPATTAAPAPIAAPACAKAAPVQQPKVRVPVEEDDDDDLDLFGSDEEDDEAERVREQRLKEYAEKKAKKPALIAKSSILLDVKPWDDETDMSKLEECVRSVQADGLLWGSSKLVPVGYGIKKLQIQCVVEDDKVGTDMLEEEITKFEDYVQSVDVAAFNKI
ncbi:hypothetical protein SKAU_G00076170 [Synaphobranchus kaupii]|uniref:Elongation factor 1-delta n=1 Tax=Synaphobranchus kaupii TaxID=118154 RepID=A0A9Q1G8S9_SYNKA|nr:hypothetical protein SKAU_G00076170 [Synaphobranchus kaupii]